MYASVFNKTGHGPPSRAHPITPFHVGATALGARRRHAGKHGGLWSQVLLLPPPAPHPTPPSSDQGNTLTLTRGNPIFTTEHRPLTREALRLAQNRTTTYFAGAALAKHPSQRYMPRNETKKHKRLTYQRRSDDMMATAASHVLDCRPYS